MHIIKRDGRQVPYDRTKIEIAIRKANYENDFVIEEKQVQSIVDRVEEMILQWKEREDKEFTVETIQQLVIVAISEVDEELASSYEKYKEKKDVVRELDKTDESILALVDGINDEVQKENSNKDPILNSTQRDLIAGEVSKDLTERYILPRHIVKAHENGIIHEHK